MKSNLGAIDMQDACWNSGHIKQFTIQIKLIALLPFRAAFNININVFNS